MIAALLRLFDRWYPTRRCEAECASAALGQMMHYRLDREVEYRRAWGPIWLAVLSRECAVRELCRRERD